MLSNSKAETTEIWVRVNIARARKMHHSGLE